MLTSLGHESSALGVARLYEGLVERFVIDEADAALAPAIERGLGMAVSPADGDARRRRSGRAGASAGGAGRGYAPRVSVRIIVPHRGLAAAKTRLAPVLDDAEREALAKRLLDGCWPSRVPRRRRGDHPPDALGPLVAAAGARLAHQLGMGLNAGLEQARREALADGIDTLIVLHGDLPNLATDDIAALLAAVPQPPGVAIAPDRGGAARTGWRCDPPDAIAFRFGVGSLRRAPRGRGGGRRAAGRGASARAGLRPRHARRPGALDRAGRRGVISAHPARGDPGGRRGMTLRR